jgi:hypothetical protein
LNGEFGLNFDYSDTNPELYNYITAPDFLKEVYKSNPTNFHEFLSLFNEDNWSKENLKAITAEYLMEVYRSNPMYFADCLEDLIKIDWPRENLQAITAEQIIDIYLQDNSCFYTCLEFLLDNNWPIENINAITLEQLKSLYKPEPRFFHDFLEDLLINGWPQENLRAITTEYLLGLYRSDPTYFHNSIEVLLQYGWPTENLQGITPEYLKELYGDKLADNLPDFADIKLQEYIDSPEALASYGLFLIENCYKYPQISGRFSYPISGRLNHHIIEIQAMLENKQNASEELLPTITQQNIIQMRSFVKSNQSEKIFDTGVMVARSCGFLDKAKISFEYTGKLSPHPDFGFGHINLDGQNTPMLIYKDWEEGDFKSININQLGMQEIESTTDSISTKINGLRVEKVLDSINVKPLGIDPNFYYAYYLTEDNLVVKICLNMSLTQTLEKEGKEALSDMALYLEKSNNIDTAIPEGTITIDQALISHSASTFTQYLMVRYPELDIKPENNTLTWSQLGMEIKKYEDTIFVDFPESYKSLIWHCNNEKAKESGTAFLKANEDMIRLMVSDDLGIYFKVCQLLKEFKILDGSNLENSHTQVFRENMGLIKVNQSSEEVLRPYIILNSSHSEVPDQNFEILEKTDTENNSPVQSSDYPCKGKEIINRNPILAHTISLQFHLKDKITINGIQVTKDQFQETTILPGSRIGV